MTSASLAAVDPWTERRERAAALLARYPFAGDVLRLYAAVVPVQERAFRSARDDAPPSDATQLASYIAERVLPPVVDVSVAHGPHRLSEAVRERVAAGQLADLVARWLGGEDQPAIERYLARVSAAPVLEALGAAAGRVCRGPREERGAHCPVCGGLPQVAYVEPSGDDLVTAPRRLLCARCGSAWIFPRLACAGCGETAVSRLVIFAETERFPHIRVDGCGTCDRYLLTVDLRKDPDAVPIVDELAALPLDLYAQERGMVKVTANMMGMG
jgi:formate dehydrogenase maturation protein FdhE